MTYSLFLLVAKYFKTTTKSNNSLESLIWTKLDLNFRQLFLWIHNIIQSIRSSVGNLNASTRLGCSWTISSIYSSKPVESSAIIGHLATDWVAKSTNRVQPKLEVWSWQISSSTLNPFQMQIISLQTFWFIECICNAKKKIEKFPVDHKFSKLFLLKKNWINTQFKVRRVIVNKLGVLRSFPFWEFCAGHTIHHSFS